MSNNINDINEIKDQMLKRQTVGKIFTEIQKLKHVDSNRKEKFRKRWLWELIQNANDCCKKNTKLDIQILFDENTKNLKFIHNGRGFQLSELWALITQASSKQSSEESTGQFGTGFITTTILSPKIKISSFLEDSGNDFEITIDRSGETHEDIAASVEENFSLLENLNCTEPNFFQSKTTVFEYDLNNSDDVDESIKAVQNGIKSLHEHARYLLVLNTSINSITVNDTKLSLYSDSQKFKNMENMKMFAVKNSAQQDYQYVAKYDFENGSLLTPLEKKDSNFSFSQISDQTARLFCKFPLVGTEKFPFPIVLNCDNFNTELDRDNIYIGDPLNTSILDTAAASFKDILNSLSSQTEVDIYNVCNLNIDSVKKMKKSQWLNSILETINNTRMVETSSGNLISITNQAGDIQVLVPTCAKEEYFDDFWELSYKLPNIQITSKDTSSGWRKIINNNFTFENVQQEYFRNKDLKKFLSIFNNGEEAIEWINKYYSIFEKADPKNLSESLLPNWSGEFKLAKTMKYTSGIDELFDLLLIIIPEMSKKIIHPKIIIPQTILSNITIFGDKEQAKLMEDRVLGIMHRLDIENNGKRESENQILFDKILIFFSKYQTFSKTNLPTLYKERNKLRPVDFSEELNKIGDIITEKGISPDSLKNILLNTEFTQAVENGLLDDPELIDRLRHEILHTPEAAIKVQKLIKRSVTNVYCSLLSNPLYTVPSTVELWKKESLSETVFKAKKQGRDILIVVRPTDEQKIIFYSEEELSTLSSDKFELWTDNNEIVTPVSLGDLLRTTQITEIPLVNLFTEKDNE